MRSYLLRAAQLALMLASAAALAAETPRELRVGEAQYAFDHLGNITNLSAAAAASGSTVIFSSGIGVFGYQGLPDAKKFDAERRSSLAYLKDAQKRGIKLAIGYVCATSIVNLNSFDANWTAEFRKQFDSPPTQWRQVDKDGRVLPSWYGAPYEPACMNNPDWRKYEKFMVKSQLESGCDGIFFDNPTVHPKGCYCPYCMREFRGFIYTFHDRFLGGHSVDSLRQYAVEHPKEFLAFRANVAADFLQDMRDYARTINSRALITCNNSLNAPDALFSQCRNMGYSINNLSRAEDLIVIEDMGSQAHQAADGRLFEYGSTYQLLHAISQGKPIVACTLIDADYYHTPPHLAELSMAEAAANDATWLLWPAWPDNVRSNIIASIRTEAEFLRRNEKYLEHAEPRSDVLVFLCYRRWLETDHCAISDAAAKLAGSRIQYSVCSEENLAQSIAGKHPVSRVLLIESFSVLNRDEKRTIEGFQRAGGKVVAADEKDWVDDLHKAIGIHSISFCSPPAIRAVVRDQAKRTVVHLYNLDVERMGSYEDKVTPWRANFAIRVPFKKVRNVEFRSPDQPDPCHIKFTAKKSAVSAHLKNGALVFASIAGSDETGTSLSVVCPVEVSALVVIEP